MRGRHARYNPSRTTTRSAHGVQTGQQRGNRLQMAERTNRSKTPRQIDQISAYPSKTAYPPEYFQHGNAREWGISRLSGNTISQQEYSFANLNKFSTLRCLRNTRPVRPAVKGWTSSNAAKGLLQDTTAESRTLRQKDTTSGKK